MIFNPNGFNECRLSFLTDLFSQLSKYALNQEKARSNKLHSMKNILMILIGHSPFRGLHVSICPIFTKKIKCSNLTDITLYKLQTSTDATETVLQNNNERY